jgi:hypothetical protein
LETLHDTGKTGSTGQPESVTTFLIVAVDANKVTAVF